jgi:hypothetical protein
VEEGAAGEGRSYVRMTSTLGLGQCAVRTLSSASPIYSRMARAFGGYAWCPSMKGVLRRLKKQGIIISQCV